MSHKRQEQDRKRERNLVAKHARGFNLAHTFDDRKAKQKRGHTKHTKGVQEYER